MAGPWWPPAWGPLLIILSALGGMMAGPLVATCLGTPSNNSKSFGGDDGRTLVATCLGTPSNNSKGFGVWPVLGGHLLGDSR